VSPGALGTDPQSATTVRPDRPGGRWAATESPAPATAPYLPVIDGVGTRGGSLDPAHPSGSGSWTRFRQQVRGLLGAYCHQEPGHPSHRPGATEDHGPTLPSYLGLNRLR
jgi:hypothetical protein